MPNPALALLALTLTVDRPLTEFPYTPGLDPAAMDRTADPCVDLYAFSCGGWKATNPVPPDQARWSVYGKLANQNQQYLWGLLEAVAAKPDAERTETERRVGDFFAACMDEGAVERAGATPLAADLAAVDGMKSKGELGALLARLHQSSSGRGLLFEFTSGQSFEDSEQVVAWVDPGGLGLPDRDLYLGKDVRSVEIRKAYAIHVERTLSLTGLPAKRAAEGAKTILRIETALAKAALTRVERRDPKRLWHKTKVTDLAKATPSFAWSAYLAATGPRVEWVNLTEPALLAEEARLLAKEPLSAWKTYLRWHLARERAPELSSAFQQESFGFFEATLRGTKELAPRWKRCVAWVDQALGEDLGQLFVARVFPPAVKADAERMVKLVQEAMARRIDALDWLSPGTRQAAQVKLAGMRTKIGYPSHWRDYAALQVNRGDHAGNMLRASAFESRRQLAKIGQPLDRSEWGMTPPSVNAYYDPQMNDMNFPAGVLMPPLWDPRIDLAPGYGNTGGTVGHELIHGFDDEGRQFDAKGNLRDWWTEADGQEFERRAQCVRDQYAQYPVVDEIRINSKLTAGEDIADLGGLLLAWDAWKVATAGQALEPRDGLTPEQRFFVGAAQWACSNDRPEDLRLRALTDPHSPPRWRINGMVGNVPDFSRAFSCKAGQPMVRETVCRIW
jgi:endothelin-converting enzyme/putative endopeptidase